MAEDPFDLDVLKKNIKLAKKLEMHFAFGQSRDKDADLLALDKKIRGERLAKEAKKRDSAVKVAFGMASYDGKAYVFTTAKPLSGMGKRVERRFKACGVTARIRIADDKGAA